MMIAWAEKAWDDYMHWQQTDKKILKRINTLLKEITRQPYEDLGAPEPLKSIEANPDSMNRKRRKKLNHRWTQMNSDFVGEAKRYSIT